jgi:hypothetical protein
MILAVSLAESDTTHRLAGPAALLVVLLLLVVTVFLVRNMDGRLRRLPKQFPADGHGFSKESDQPDRPEDHKAGTALVEIPPQD